MAFIKLSLNQIRYLKTEYSVSDCPCVNRIYMYIYDIYFKVKSKIFSLDRIFKFKSN